jgi:predicted KAP-like P-loop ATPase
MGLGDETISIAEVDELIERSGDIDYVKQTFLKALSSIRKNEKSNVPLLFDEINAHASRIEKTKFEPFISAIFEIADDLYRYEDNERGGFSIGNNYLRIHWLIRKLTFERCSLEERSKIFLAACQRAQVGWIVDFTSSAISDVFPRKGREREPAEKWLVGEEYVPKLRELAIEAIQSAAANGKLIYHPQLPFILFRWVEFAEEQDHQVKEWTDDQLKSDETVGLLAKAFTGETWSQGIGMAGLGDRVAIRTTRAQIKGLEKIVDVKQFRRRIEELENSKTLDNRHKESISIFLQAWRKQEAGDED